MASIDDRDALKELRRLEEKTEKALKTIKSLYREIMGINDTDCKELDFVNAEERTLSTSKSKSVEMLSPRRFMRKKRSEMKNVLRENCEMTQPVVRREKKMPEHITENYWYHLQNPCIAPDIPESSKKNLIEQGNYVAQSAKTTVQKAESDADHCCPLKVTIPEPFQMTLREMEQKENREFLMQKLKEKWNKSSEEELGKKIHARPVPSHVHLPLYQKIVETNEQKKIQRKQQILQRLKELSKPFNLTLKSNLKHHKSKSLPDLTSANQRFKARPAPQNILSVSVSESLKENEKRRKLRIAERSQELLKSSSLPFSEKKPLRRSSSMGNLSQEHLNMAIKSRSRHVKNKQNLRLSGLEPKDISKQWKNEVTALHQQEEIRMNAVNKGAIAKSKDFLISQALPFYDVPVKTTTSAMLREKQNRLILHERETTKEQESAEKEKRVENQKQFRKILVQKLKEVDPHPDLKKHVEQQLKMLREARNLRQKEYEKELEGMKSRVQKQPLLVERQSQKHKKSEKPPLDSTIEISDDEDDDTISKYSGDVSKK